jgi:SOS response regulatory protein OraA/RecX
VRSCAEALAYLAAQGVPSIVASQAVEVCEQQGWLNDRACAQLWASHWARLGYAQAVIAQRLEAKGLSSSVIRQALPMAGKTADTETAQALVQRAARQRTGPGATMRLAARLRRRGFDEDVITDVLLSSGRR